MRALAVCITVAVTLLPLPARAGAAPIPLAAIDDPIDPQVWQDQQDMTWDDYRPVPGANWADPNSTNITSVQTDRRTSQTVARGVSGRMALGGTR